MKTISKHFQQAGNITLIQFETLEGEGLRFNAAAPAMEKDGLVIREVRQEGSVNTLLAINQTDDYLLLTDMDLLRGAKQNRVVNTSVLLAPRSKQEVNVSCVERSRWTYDSPSFKPGPDAMDSKLRAAKAEALRMDLKSKMSSAQSKIWGMINEEMVSSNIINETEDYSSILESKKTIIEPERRFLPENQCNGLAVFEGHHLVSFDLFGNRVVYQYYFEKLSSDALGRIRDLTAQKDIGEAEAFYRLDEFLDLFESELDSPADSDNANVGTLRWSGAQQFPGFELSYEGQLVHLAGFERG